MKTGENIKKQENSENTEENKEKQRKKEKYWGKSELNLLKDA